jgi:hypothetical protein
VLTRERLDELVGRLDDLTLESLTPEEQRLFQRFLLKETTTTTDYKAEGQSLVREWVPWWTSIEGSCCNLNMDIWEVQPREEEQEGETYWQRNLNEFQTA